MSLSDEELQSNIEKGSRVDDTLDSRAYHKVFDALKKEPYHLPFHFADHVMKRLEAQGSLSKDYFWFGLGLLSFFVATILAVVHTDFRLNFSGFKFISGYYGLLVFATVFIVLIQYLDKKFVKPKMSV